MIIIYRQVYIICYCLPLPRKLRRLANASNEKLKTLALRLVTSSVSRSTPLCPPHYSSGYSSQPRPRNPTEPSDVRWWSPPTSLRPPSQSTEWCSLLTLGSLSKRCLCVCVCVCVCVWQLSLTVYRVSLDELISKQKYAFCS